MLAGSSSAAAAENDLGTVPGIMRPERFPIMNEREVT
jgi:hypothetical protein